MSRGGGSRRRIIVRLRLDVADEPSSAGETAKRARIAAARSRLLASFAPDDLRLTRAYATLPWVALEASPEALAALRESPLVESIADDELASVQGSEDDPAATPHLSRR